MARKTPPELGGETPNEVGEVTPPHTSYLTKAVAGGLAVVTSGGLLYGWDHLRAIPVAGAAQVAHHAPAEPVVSRLEVAEIAARLAAEAAMRVEARSEERRLHDRELVQQQFARVNDKLTTIAEKLDLVSARLESAYEPRRNRTR